MQNREYFISVLEKANEVRIDNLPESIILVDEVLKSEMIENYIELKAKALSQLALYTMITGENEDSLQYAQQSIKLYEELNDEKGIADAKYCIAGVYYKTDNYHLALVYIIDALNIYKKDNDFFNISRCEKTLATIYEYSGDIETAIKSLKNAIKAGKRIDNANLESNAYNNLSGLYIKEGKIDLAEKTIRKSIALKSETGDVRGMAFAVYGRAKVHLVKKEYDLAKAEFLESIRIHSEMGERLGLTMAYHKFAKLYFEIDEMAKAKEILSKCVDLCEQYNISIIRIKAYFLFYNICRREGDTTKALDYLESYLQLKEKVLNTQTLRVIDSYDTLVKMKTVQKEAEFLRERAEMIEKTNKAHEIARVRQDFLSTMSHEIRTPLNAITTITSLLSEKTNEEDQKLIDTLKFSANHLMMIINDILDFNKLDLGKMKLDLNPVSIRKLVEDIYKTYEFPAKEKNLEFDLVTNISLEETYLIDNTKITQIVGNLLCNAIKFTESGKVGFEVNIQKRLAEHDLIEFKVTDTGEGINAENLDKIFESFTQINNRITRKSGGTGLGLAIVKKLIELHGSDIKVESESGKGTQFIFSLKLKKVAAIVETVGTNGSFDLNGRKVLLAEDNPVNAMIAKKLLSNWGIITDHAQNGIEAVKKAETNTYDYILMDIHMPEMDGFEATEIIRKSKGINAEIPIFALTADISAVEHESYFSVFSGFLLKPIEIDKLKIALSTVKVYG